MAKTDLSYLTLLFLLGNYAQAINEIEEGNMESAHTGKSLHDLNEVPANFDWYVPGLNKEAIATEVQRMENWLETQDLSHFKKTP